MERKLKAYSDFSGGLVSYNDHGYLPRQLQDNEFCQWQNAQIDGRGKLVFRTLHDSGTKIGQVIATNNYPCLAQHVFHKSDGQHYLLGFFGDGSLRYCNALTPATWPAALATGWVTSLLPEFETWDDKVYITNGNLIPKYFDGTALVDFAAAFTLRPRLMRAFKRRMLWANVPGNPCRLYVSALGTPETLPILFFDDFNPNEGEITAIVPQVENRVLIFKSNNEVWLFVMGLQADLSDSEIYLVETNYGCFSPKAIQKLGDAVVYPTYERKVVALGNISFKAEQGSNILRATPQVTILSDNIDGDLADMVIPQWGMERIQYHTKEEWDRCTLVNAVTSAGAGFVYNVATLQSCLCTSPVVSLGAGVTRFGIMQLYDPDWDEPHNPTPVVEVKVNAGSWTVVANGGVISGTPNGTTDTLQFRLTLTVSDVGYTCKADWIKLHYSRDANAGYSWGSLIKGGNYWLSIPTGTNAAGTYCWNGKGWQKFADYGSLSDFYKNYPTSDEKVMCMGKAFAWATGAATKNFYLFDDDNTAVVHPAIYVTFKEDDLGYPLNLKLLECVSVTYKASVASSLKLYYDTRQRMSALASYLFETVALASTTSETYTKSFMIPQKGETWLQSRFRTILMKLSFTFDAETMTNPFNVQIDSIILRFQVWPDNINYSPEPRPS